MEKPIQIFTDSRLGIFIVLIIVICTFLVWTAFSAPVTSTFVPTPTPGLVKHFVYPSLWPGDLMLGPDFTVLEATKSADLILGVTETRYGVTASYNGPVKDAKELIAIQLAEKSWTITTVSKSGNDITTLSLGKKEKNVERTGLITLKQNSENAGTTQIVISVTEVTATVRN
jgi:hypothetical protein